MFKIKGLDVLKRELSALQRGADKALESTVTELTVSTLSIAKANVHVISGDLRDSGGIETVNIDSKKINKVYFSMFYAAYEEFGTGAATNDQGYRDEAMQFYVSGRGYNQPHPFLFPAFFQQRNKALQTLTDNLKQNTQLRWY